MSVDIEKLTAWDLATLRPNLYNQFFRAGKSIGRQDGRAYERGRIRKLIRQGRAAEV